MTDDTSSPKTRDDAKEETKPAVPVSDEAKEKHWIVSTWLETFPSPSKDNKYYTFQEGGKGAMGYFGKGKADITWKFIAEDVLEMRYQDGVTRTVWKFKEKAKDDKLTVSALDPKNMRELYQVKLSRKK